MRCGCVTAMWCSSGHGRVGETYLLDSCHAVQWWFKSNSLACQPVGPSAPHSTQNLSTHTTRYLNKEVHVCSARQLLLVPHTQPINCVHVVLPLLLAAAAAAAAAAATVQTELEAAMPGSLRLEDECRSLLVSNKQEFCPVAGCLHNVQACRHATIVQQFGP